MKIERNETCICGSGRKNKICCNKERITEEEFDELIMKAASLSLEQNEKALLKSMASLEQFLDYKDISHNARLNILSNLIGTYQRRGLHVKALNTIASLKIFREGGSNFSGLFITCQEASSLCAMQKFGEAVALLDGIKDELLAEADNRNGTGLLLVEAGKIYIYGERLESAKKCLEKCILVFKDNLKEQETVEKAKANLAFILIKDEDEKIVEKGIKLLERSINKKAVLGDLVGLSINYSNLGLHYFSKKNYKSAFAYFRKDLWISRQVGDLHAIDISLRNMTIIYAELKQFKEAKRMISESAAIGAKLSDQLIIQMSEEHLKKVKEFARQAAVDQIVTGPLAMCACGENKSYQDCCGITDHDPIDLPFRIAGSSEFLNNEKYKFEERIQHRNKLDFIFKDAEHSSERRSWNIFQFKNGWYEMHELPDMSNHYMLSAKALLNSLNGNPDSIEIPLSCLIMSVCALEAFINQVAYFFYDERNASGQLATKLSSMFEMSAFEFQKNTELTNKWTILGNELCKDKWIPDQQLWNDFKNLIYIRNEFIHFKLTEYERVIPPPKALHPILNKVPKTVQLRNVYHSWPVRLLTDSFAQWTVNTAQTMILFFKTQYNRNDENEIQS